MTADNTDKPGLKILLRRGVQAALVLGVMPFAVLYGFRLAKDAYENGLYLLALAGLVFGVLMFFLGYTLGNRLVDDIVPQKKQNPDFGTLDDLDE